MFSIAPLRSSRSIRLISKRTLCMCLFIGISSLIVRSQNTEAPSDAKADLVQSLMERIVSLEASQKQLQERIARLEGMPSKSPVTEKLTSVSNTVPASVNAVSPSADAAAASSNRPVSQQDAQSPMGGMEHADAGKTLLNIRGFGDFGLYGGDQRGQTTSFSVGQMNLFITSNLSDRFRFLTELVFEVHQNNEFEEDLERILLEYSMNDYFTVSAGRYHTAIGYYNTAYHHATWFQTATERPYIFEYEDEGGILPIHNVGLQASGRIPSGALGLHYVFEVGNGRPSGSPEAQPVQNFVDQNNHKAVNVAVFARPDRTPGLQTGFSIYRDVIASAASPKINETILDGYAVWTRSRFEWLNEALMIRHTPLGQSAFNTPAFYSQISERFGLYRPYLRYQYVNASSSEPVFPQVGLRTGPSVGIRYEASDSVALKLQYDHTNFSRQRPIIDGKDCPQLSMCAPNALAMQVDFKF